MQLCQLFTSISNLRQLNDNNQEIREYNVNQRGETSSCCPIDVRGSVQVVEISSTFSQLQESPVSMRSPRTLPITDQRCENQRQEGRGASNSNRRTVTRNIPSEVSRSELQSSDFLNTLSNDQRNEFQSRDQQNDRLLLYLSTIQIMLGSLIVIVDIISVILMLKSNSIINNPGIIAGFFVFIAGMVGLFASKSISMNLLYMCVISNVAGASSCLIVFIFIVFNLSSENITNNTYIYHKNCFVMTLLMFDVLFTIGFVIFLAWLISHTRFTIIQLRRRIRSMRRPPPYSETDQITPGVYSEHVGPFHLRPGDSDYPGPPSSPPPPAYEINQLPPSYESTEPKPEDEA